jgi:Protein of unknown function (DUF2585)
VSRRLRHAAAAALVLAGMAAILAALGRAWWCAAGDAGLWSGDVWSRHNSQHLVDPYTFTHVLHGLVFYAGVWLLVPRAVGALGRWWIGFGLEVGWEILENTDALIERYRGTTVSLDYFGDSIANAIGDVLAYVVGWGLAGLLPVWTSVALFAAVEGMLMLWIRDGLLLNVLMLVYPLDALRRWQTGGGS